MDQESHCAVLLTLIFLQCFLFGALHFSFCEIGVNKRSVFVKNTATCDHYWTINDDKDEACVIKLNNTDYYICYVVVKSLSLNFYIKCTFAEQTIILLF